MCMQVASGLGTTTRGARFKAAIGKLADWHLLHPKATHKDALQWLRQQGHNLMYS